MLNENTPIARRLRESDRVHQFESGISLCLRCVPYVLGLIIVAFVLDVVFHLTSGHRVFLIALWMAAVLAALGFSLWVAEMVKNGFERIARRLEDRNPTLGSKLINILQLGEQSGDPRLDDTTRKLADLAIEQSSENIKSCDLTELTRTDRVRRSLKVATWSFATFALILLAGFKISAIEMKRFLDPFGDHPPFSLTQLEIYQPGPDGTNVVYNESLVVKADHTGHHPKELYLSFHPLDKPDEITTVPMFDKGDEGFYQQIDGIKTDLKAFVHTKSHHSYSKQREIGVILTPKLEKAWVQVSPPKYTKKKGRERQFDFKTVRALKDSVVNFRMRSNRPLKSGVIEFTTPDGNSQQIRMHGAEHEVRGAFMARGSGRLKFAFTDVDDIESDETWEASLVVTHDLPPSVRIEEPQRDSFVSMDFKIDGRVAAGDDYGLSQIRIHRGLNGVYAPPRVVLFQDIERYSVQPVPFDFKDLGVSPGDTITFFAEAVDNRPDPQLARSETVQMHVITEEEYNTWLRRNTDLDYLRSKYSELENELIDLAEEQRQLGEKIEELKAKIAKAGDKASPEDIEKLDQLMAEQNEINRKLDKLADKMAGFVRDSPLYDFEEGFEEYLQARAKMIKEITKQTDKANSQVGQQSSPQGSPRQLTPQMLEQMKQASDEQMAALGAQSEQLEEKVGETIEDLAKMQEIMKDLNRFEHLYRNQEMIASQTKAYRDMGELSREDQIALKSLAAQEKDIAEELKLLKEKLERDADAAEEKFPKAAQGARDLARQMEEKRLTQLGEQATRAMLAAKSRDSADLSEKLRAEMESMFCESCQGNKQGEMQSEVDQYLRLTRGMKPGNSFEQMRQTMKQGYGQKFGLGQARGPAGQGESGYSMTSGPAMDVLGSETHQMRNAAKASDRSGNGNQADLKDDSENLALDDADVLKRLNATNRQSGAVVSESIGGRFSDIVDEYFKTITK